MGGSHRVILALLALSAAGMALASCTSKSRDGFVNDPNAPAAGGFGDAGTTGDAKAAPIDKCKVPADEDNGGGLECTKSAPPDSFTPVLKWKWSGKVGGGSIVTPLVGNFTDDNGDGKIDLCDIPDVLVTDMGSSSIVMLAGDDGHEELRLENIDANVTPAFGDLDGDGVPEIVANDEQGHLVVFSNDGDIKWKGPDVGTYKQESNSYCHAIAIYDLDADGTPEIIAGFEVFTSKGKSLFAHSVSAFSGQYWCPANTAADLDGDGKLEVVFGNAAYHADGSLYWKIDGPPGQPQIANLDADPEPEVFVARQDGILIIEHDGKIKVGPNKFVNDPTSPNCWSKPGAVHDFDGDGIADVSASTCTKYGVSKIDAAGALSVIWSATIDDTSGLASCTAFDFLGRGTAQAVYGDQKKLWVFDGKTGAVAFEKDRSSGTLIEYPVVADVDNDQSADIVVVSNGGAADTIPTVQVFEDADKRWIPTRRIWNQHAYHVTNVREDGTIPKVMKKSWQRLNTFRTNAQVEGNGDCAPPPSNPPK